MNEPTLTFQQADIAHAPLHRKLFLAGPVGTGKTTTGVGRLLHLLEEGVPADAVLVMAPQRTLALPYDRARRSPRRGPGGQINLATVGGLARRMADLFWPLVVEEARFGKPDERPTFLTLETSQYFMARVVEPFLEKGYFESLTIDRNRLYSQILDNLNKAAVMGFPVTETAARLKAAWVGEKSQLRVYDEAEECAVAFRRYCLEHNLLDFSLQLEVFVQHLWPEPLVQDYLVGQYTHLIFDNLEEDTPVTHDLLRDWLPHAESALLVYDADAGHRTFLGADPGGAYALRELCDETVVFEDSFVVSPGVQAFGSELEAALTPTGEPVPGAAFLATPPALLVPAPAPGTGVQLRDVLRFESRRYHPEMLDWVAATIAGLVHDEGTHPSKIVVLAPFLSDVLRFSLIQRLEDLEVPARSHRPSRALRDEPATQTLLTLAAIAHPEWGVSPTRYDLAYALMQAVDGMDLVRAQLIADILYRVRDGVPTLEPFDQLQPEMQQRITYLLGGRYEALRIWFRGYAADPLDELDHFLSRLFGELLSQPGFGFHDDFDAGRVAANLIESVQKFRWIAGQIEGGKPLGQEYVEMVQAGVVAAQYVRNWKAQDEDAVFLAPAYTFLMSNRPVDYQFWLNLGSLGWWERLYQPVTHPYVLRRGWPSGELWTDSKEVGVREGTLRRLVEGLVRRCRKGIFLGLSDLDEQGYDQQGPLLKAVQRVLRDSRVNGWNG